MTRKKEQNEKNIQKNYEQWNVQGRHEVLNDQFFPATIGNCLRRIYKICSTAQYNKVSSVRNIKRIDHSQNNDIIYWPAVEEWKAPSVYPPRNPSS